jgi:hypothetical protein
LPPCSTLYMMHSLFQAWNISLYKPLEYAFEKNCQAPPYTSDAMRARSRRGAGELIEGSEQQACHGRRATACKKGWVHGGEINAEPGADSDRVGCCEGGGCSQPGTFA